MSRAPTETLRAGRADLLAELPPLALHLVDGAGVELHQTERLQLLTGGHHAAERRCWLRLAL